jgi:RNase P subunit RPR2
VYAREMRDAISEIVGQGQLSNGKSAQVYRALRRLLCSACGAEIAEDSLFTRRSVKGFGLNIMPQCRKCAPFALLVDKKEKKVKSELLQSLLREQPPNSAERERPSDGSRAESAPEDKKNIAEEVRRRLAPALKRGRRGLK